MDNNEIFKTINKLKVEIPAADHFILHS